jgi:hypothetical protein
MVFARRPAQPHLVGREHHVMVRRRDVDGARHQRLPVLRMDRAHGAARCEQLRQDAVVAAHVQHHAHHRVHVLRHRRCQFQQRRDAAGGGANDDGMETVHAAGRNAVDQVILRGFGHFEMQSKLRSRCPTRQCRGF